MTSPAKCIWLFVLNLLDAVLTVVWVKMDIASEGNILMAIVLDWGVAPFILVKLGVGAFAAVVLFRFSHLLIAKRGLQFALAAYCALMFIHFAAGMSVLGWDGPVEVVAYLHQLPYKFFGSVL